MANNVIANTSDAGGATFATDEISSVHYAISKLAFGADGTATWVTTTDGLPVQFVSGSTVAATQSGTWNVTDISGTVSLPTGASTLAEQQSQTTLLGTIDADTGAIATSAASIDTKTPALGQALAAGSVPVVLTAAQLSTLTPPAAITGFATAANQLPDGHNVTVDNASIAVTQSGTWDEVGINDSGNSITVDAPVGTPVFVRLSDGSAAITTLPVSLASVPSHAVTNAGTFAVQAAQSGTWTVDLGATDNGVLDAIAASLAGTLTVGSHAVTNAGTFAVQSTLQAGTAYAGKVRLTDGTTDTDIRDLTNSNALNVAIVDGSGDQITSFGGGTQYTEGDTDASITGTAMLWEDTSNTLATVSAGSPLPVAIISGAGSGGTAAADDADFTAGTTNGTPAMGVFESSPSNVTDGDLGTIGITQNREVKTSDATAASILTTIDADTGSIDSKITACDTGAVVVSSSALPTGAATEAKQPALGTAGSASSDVLSVQGITSMTPLLVDGSTGVFPISDNAGSITVDNAGTFAVQVDGDALTALQLIDNAVSGSGFNITQLNGVNVTMGNGASGTGVQRVTLASDSTGVLAGVTTLTGGGVAHDSADSGNPHKIGARAAATLSDDTMVANADRTDAVADLDGAIIVRNQFPLGDLITERVSNTDGSSTAFTNFGATASTRNYVTAIAIHNASATVGYVDFRDGTAGSVLFTVPIPAEAGVVLSGGGLPLFRTTANTALAYDVSGALTTVYISITGFKSKV